LSTDDDEIHAADRVIQLNH